MSKSFQAARSCLSLLLSLCPVGVEKFFRFVSKSASNADNYNMSLNGEKRAIKKILSSLPPQCVVYDVGANKGGWSLHVREFSAGAQIYAFEMIPEFADIARRQLGSNNVLNIGLSDSASEIEVWQYGGGASVKKSATSSKIGKQVRVKIMRGDDLKLPRPDFIKMDTEGHELAVMRGLEKTIRTCKPIIQFEYGIGNITERVLLKDIFDFLKGYEFYQIFPTKLVYREYEPSLENHWTVNYIAMPLEKSLCV